MDYKELARNCEARAASFRMQRNREGAMHEFQCSRSITDLLARAEAAERERDRLREVLDTYGGEYGITEILKQKEVAEAREGLYEGIADKYQKEIVPRLKERLEKAEKCTKAIEDKLGDDFDLERIRELVEADQDERCAVLPCKVGDTAWFNTYSCNAKVCHGIKPHKVKSIRIYAIVEGEHTDVGLSIDQFGRSWFLNQKAAKVALKGEQDG